MFFPIWPEDELEWNMFLKRVLYITGLLWSFLGVAIIASIVSRGLWSGAVVCSHGCSARDFWCSAAMACKPRLLELVQACVARAEAVLSAAQLVFGYASYCC